MDGQLTTYTMPKNYGKKLLEFQKKLVSSGEGDHFIHNYRFENFSSKISTIIKNTFFFSAKITSLGMNDSTNAPTDKELKLQKSISIGINGYIQSKILTLLALPSEETYKKLQDERR